MDEHDLFMEGGDGRRRSNTWPLPEPPAYNTKSEVDSTSPAKPPQQQLSIVEPSPKKSSRKNAWGNMSYADLITQAIQSSEDKRMTLSQIYDWMVNSISYFRDKGDSNSSAGWKNSIRHNLSLHSKFVRVQNEGSGKSSWWTINPDAKGGKTSRRRSGSLDSVPKTERKGRGRSRKDKKDPEEAPTSPRLAVVTKLTRSPSPLTVSPTSSSSDSLQTIPESGDSPLPFLLNDSFGRPRTNSDLSTVSSIGRPSSPAVDELENDEGMCVPTMSTPCCEDLIELTDTMTRTNLSPVSTVLPTEQPQNDLKMAPMNSSLPTNSFESGYESGYLPVISTPQQLSSEVLQPRAPQLFNGIAVTPPFQGGYDMAQANPDGNRIMQQPARHYREQNMDMTQNHVSLFQGFGFGNGSRLAQNAVPQNCNLSDPYLQQLTNPALIMNNNNGHHHQQQQLQHQHQQLFNRVPVNHQLEIMNQKFPSDLDLQFDAFEGGLECDMDSILNDELIMGDGALDFNFEQFISHTAFPNNPPVTVGELAGRLY